MKRVWTEEQQAAITMQDTLLVAAGAGSGKTAVLIQRILTAIMDPDGARDVDEFLVVTYTKAAALEMKTRLREAIEQELRREQGLNDHLLTQLLLINKASITTLHAFGGELLRQFFHVLGMEPNFRVMEEAQAQMLLRELTEGLINEAYERAEREEDSLFLEAVRFFADGYKDTMLAETVLRVRGFAMSQPRPREWLAGLATAYELEEEGFFAGLWGRALLEQGESFLEEAAWGLSQAVRLAALPNGPREYLPVLEQDERDVLGLSRCLSRCTGTAGRTAETEGAAEDNLPIREAMGSCETNGFLDMLGRVLPGRLAPVRKTSVPLRDEEVLAALKAEVMGLRDGYKKVLKGLKQVWIVSPLAEQLAAARPSGRIVRGIVALVVDLMDAYRDEKRKRNCVDFSDLEHMPLELLRDQPEIAGLLRLRFHEVLVDEYQDISPVQEELLSMLSRRGRQFLVGDIKQSIYRFRMADPGLFNEKYSSFRPWRDAAAVGEREDCDGIVIDLRHNFRSHPMIIALVNEVFGKLMKRETAEIDYDERARLVAAAKVVSGEDEPGGMSDAHAVELHLVERASSSEAGTYGVPEGSDNDDEDDGPAGELFDVETARFEAHVVARRICRMVDESEGMPGLPSFRYRDIAILMRSMAAAMRVYREVFDEYGIPFVAADSAGASEAVEMEVAMALLQIIDNPHQDIPLLAVLHSFLVGLSAEELSRVRLVCPDGNFYEAVCAVVWCAAGERCDERDEQILSGCAEILSVFEERELEAMRGSARALLGDEAVLAERLECFWRDLMRWRSVVAREALPDFVWRLYQDTNMLHYVGMMPEGNRRQGNLLDLYEDAVAYARDHSRSLASFLRFREKAAELLKGDRRAGAAVDEVSDVVRFMTVHGSKGLEFPVVFVTGLGRRFNRKSLDEKVLLHKDLGMGIAGFDGWRRVAFPSPVREAVRWVLAREAVAEEMRVFYVAVTRAKEKLVLVGSCKDLAKSKERLRQPVSHAALSPSGVRNASSCLNWLEMALCEKDDERGSWRLTPYSVSDMLKIVVKAHNRMKPSLFIERSFDPDALKLADLDEKLLWCYGYVDHVVKTSVSGIGKVRDSDAGAQLLAGDEGAEMRFPAGEDAEARPLSEEDEAEKRSRALEKGRVVHKFFQLIPWRLWSGEWCAWNETKRYHVLRGHLQDLVERELIVPDMCDAVPLESAAVFLSSSLGERIFAADELYTELPFILGMVMGADRQRILVQGTADLVAVYHSADDHADRALVVDFKTDRIRYDGGAEVLADRYALQLAIYGRAVRKLMRVAVEDSLIYAISADRAVAVDAERMERALAEAELADEG